MRKPRRKAVWLSIIAVVVLSAGVLVTLRSRMGIGSSASAPDSTALSDSTAGTKAAAKNKKDRKNKKKGTPEDTRVPVEVTTVAPRSISTYYQTTATLEPDKRVDILAKIAGEVVEIVAEEGDFVKTGGLLCRLNDAELKVALEQARINRDKQKSELERVETMHTQSLISDKEYEDVRYQFELAENSYESARVKYEYAHIRAPFSGVVTQRLVDQGQNIGIGAHLFVMSDTQPLLLNMYLPEAEARHIRPGQAVLIRSDARPDIEYDGEVLRIAPEVDQRTGTIKVTAQTLAGGVPGSFVRVRILTGTHTDVHTVPRRSVVADAGDRFVFIAAADTVRKVGVEVGYEDESYAEVTRGLSIGDTVVIAGVGGIRDGSKVKIVRPGESAAPAEPVDTAESKD